MELLKFLLNDIFFVLLEAATFLVLYLLIIERLSFLRFHWLKSLSFVSSFLVLHHFLSGFDKLPHTLFYVAFNILVLAYITNSSLYTSLLVNIFVFLIYIVTETLVLIPVSLFMGSSVTAIKNDAALLLKTLLLVRPVQTALIVLLARLRFKTGLFQHELLKKNNPSVTYLLLIIFLIIAFFSFISRNFELVDFLISGILFFMVGFLSILELNEAVKLKEIANRLKLQEEYSRNMEAILDAVRKEKHDFKNHISTLVALCTMQESGVADSVKTYARKLTNNDNFSGFCFYQAGNKYLDGLLSVKSNIAKNDGIHFEVDIETTLERISVDDVDLTSIVGNIVDNAFDAVSFNPAFKSRIVSLSIYEENGQCCISISNNGKEIPEADKKHIFDYKFSTKKKEKGDRGYGLFIVKELISRNQGKISFHSDEFETEFLVTFQIKPETAPSLDKLDIQKPPLNKNTSVLPK